MLNEDKIKEIDHDYSKTEFFDDNSLFFNINYYWCFSNYLSMYYIWRLTALDELKSNLRKEWCEGLPNVELFIDLVDRGTKVLSPIKCHPNSEFYFEKIIKWKIDFEKEFIKPHHIVKKTHKKKLIRKTIR